MPSARSLWSWGLLILTSAYWLTARNISSDGKFSAWWETYFRDEGFEGIYCYFDGLHALGQYGGAVVGMLGMDIPRLNRGHIVAVDEFGVVDPADNAPDHDGIEIGKGLPRKHLPYWIYQAIASEMRSWKKMFWRSRRSASSGVFGPLDSLARA